MAVELGISVGGRVAAEIVMALAERDGTQALPIWIGPARRSLAVALQSAGTPRPFTYKLAPRPRPIAGPSHPELSVSANTSAQLGICLGSEHGLRGPGPKLSADRGDQAGRARSEMRKARSPCSFT